MKIFESPFKNTSKQIQVTPKTKSMSDRAKKLKHITNTLSNQKLTHDTSYKAKTSNYCHIDCCYKE